MWFLLNILKPNFATCDWFWADGSHILSLLDRPIFSTASSSPTPVSSFRLRFSSTSTRTRTLPTGLQMLRIFSPWLLLLYDLHILFIIPNILHSMSFVQQPSSFIKPPRYTNSVTCSSVSPSIFWRGAIEMVWVFPLLSLPPLSFVVSL